MKNCQKTLICIMLFCVIFFAGCSSGEKNNDELNGVLDTPTDDISQSGSEDEIKDDDIATEDETLPREDEAEQETINDMETSQEAESPTEPPTKTPTIAPTEPPTQAPTDAPTEPPTEAPTEQNTESPTEAPTEAPTEPSVTNKITLISITDPIGRNEEAIVKVKGLPNTEYVIEVHYPSGISNAEGLGAKTSDADGNVSWTWKIGGSTSQREHYLIVKGNGVSSDKIYFTVQ